MIQHEIIPRKIFLKGELYTHSSATVMCTETTCSYSSSSFKGVVIKSKKHYPGSYDEDWNVKSFEKQENNESNHI